MSTTYGIKRDYGNTTYGASGLPSFEAAELNCMERAFRDGNWCPAQLRERWWQFWRPKEHSELTSKFIERNPDWMEQTND